MNTFTKVLLTGAAIAIVGGGAAFARMHDRGPGGPFGGHMGGERMYEHLCDGKGPQMNPDRMAERISKDLKLTDAQKPAFDDLKAAFTKTHEDVKAAVCADKPDFSTLPSRMSFDIKAAEAHLNGMKAVQPKLEAFYTGLTDEQKKTFDRIGPHGRGDGERGKHHGWMHDGKGPGDSDD